MFISNAEKSQIDARISYLEGAVRHLRELLVNSQKSSGWSAEAREAQSARMKKAWAKRKAKK